VSQAVTAVTPWPKAIAASSLITIVLDANAEPIPNRVATSPIASIPFEDFLPLVEVLPLLSKRNISIITPYASFET
jgi:hypothetical protein